MRHTPSVLPAQLLKSSRDRPDARQRTTALPHRRRREAAQTGEATLTSHATPPSAPLLPAALAFLSVVEIPAHGLLGGLLLLNRTARPLEFHCTAPVRPNRVQELLYGPTLKPFLYGELIARTLLAKATAGIAVALLDQPELLAARDHVSVPLALVCRPQGGDALSEGGGRLMLPGSGPVLLQPLAIGPNRLAIPSADAQRVHDALADVGQYLDLAEPFERIRNAIEEAHRVSRAA